MTAMPHRTSSDHQDGLRQTLAAMPKVDLHRHLEGSLRLSTLFEIAMEHGLDLGAMSLEELRPLVQMVDDTPDFQGFLAKFEILRHFYSTRETVLRIAYEVVADAAHDNVKYLELRFNPVAQAHHQGFQFGDVMDWVLDATQRAAQDFDTQVRLIVTLNRQEPQYARQLAELAVARMSQGIVGLDLAGDEEHYACDDFVDVMRWAREQGMFLTVHAAECRRCPAANVREAIELIHADRIGHGVHALKDIGVIDLLRRKQVTLEMCPTSNIQTDAVDGLSQHPLMSFHYLGIPVTINTDDPSVSNITLTDEYLVAMLGIGVTFETLKSLILNSAQAAFLPPTERAALVTSFQQALDAISPPPDF